jgi:hypothetical protein
MLIIARRESPGREEHEATDYIPCPDCKVFVIKENLWHHAIKSINRGPNRDCDDEDDDNTGDKGLSNYVRRGKYILNSYLLKQESDLLVQLFRRMNDSEENDVIAKDKLIKKNDIYSFVQPECKQP